jgi:hypothetical protein
MTNSTLNIYHFVRSPLSDVTIIDLEPIPDNITPLTQQPLACARCCGLIQHGLVNSPCCGAEFHGTCAEGYAREKKKCPQCGVQMSQEASTSAVTLTRTMLRNDGYNLSANSRHERGAIYINNEKILGPPVPGQKIREIRVDQTSYFYICDEALRSLCTRFQVSSLIDTANRLQRVFIYQKDFSEETSQSIADSQAELSSHLLGAIQSYAGCEEQIRNDWNSNGPGPLARQFIAYVLSYLQHQPASVGLDKDWIISSNKPLSESSRHIFEVYENGVLFDFSPSFHLSSVIFKSWEDFEPLYKIGIEFDGKRVENIPVPEWFVRV